MTHETTDLEQDIASIAEQQRRLRFTSFNKETAWDLGSRLRALAIARDVTVTIEVRLTGETAFFCSMSGTSPANAD